VKIWPGMAEFYLPEARPNGAAEFDNFAGIGHDAADGDPSPARLPENRARSIGCSSRIDFTSSVMTMVKVKHGENNACRRRANSLLPILALLLSAVAAAQRPAITGISHVTLYADDLRQSRQFYGELLGWRAVPLTGPAPGLRFYPNHAQYVELLPSPVPGQANRLDHVSFATDDAEALRRLLASKGIAVPVSITAERDGSRSFRVHDPEGNLVEFTEQGRAIPSPPPSALTRRLSTHIMHAGYVVRDRAALDHFYQDALGFHLYWQGGAKTGDVDWVMMQVPDGTDWIEYMLYLPANPTRAQLGSADHIAPGVVSTSQLEQRLEALGWKPPLGKNPQVLGVDGKRQLDLTDPDGTRIEFMEFAPVEPPCCSPYTGRQPIASDTW
jgi:catechol 2,3-dioxygenase-like lactoylglutathione lyase family enzyme